MISEQGSVAASGFLREESQHEERPHHVELVFNAERPHVGERQGSERHRAEHLSPIELREQGAQCRDDLFVGDGHRDEDGGDRNARQRHEQLRGKQSQGSAKKEVRQIDRTILLEFLEQEARDQKTAENEEDIDAEKAASERILEMCGDYDQAGDAAQTVERRNVAKPKSAGHRSGVDGGDLGGGSDRNVFTESIRGNMRSLLRLSRIPVFNAPSARIVRDFLRSEGKVFPAEVNGGSAG